MPIACHALNEIHVCARSRFCAIRIGFIMELEKIIGQRTSKSFDHRRLSGYACTTMSYPKSLGCLPIVATHGKEGVEKAISEKPKLILMISECR